MKINARLLSIIFFVVVLMSVSSGIIYYSFTIEILKSQQVNNLQNTKKDFIFSFQNILLENDYEIDKILFANLLESSQDLSNTPLDFIFIVSTSEITKVLKGTDTNVFYESNIGQDIKSFIDQNPNYLIQYKKIDATQSIYYGNIINENYLNEIAEEVNAEIVLFNNGNIISQSHESINKKYSNEVIDIKSRLKQNYNNNILTMELIDVDLAVTVLATSSLNIIRDDIQFLLYNSSTAQKDFSNRMLGLFVTYTIAGIALSLILVLLFTSKIREQIKTLIESVEETSKGNLDHRVPIVSTTELGKLGLVYNNMLDELQKREKKEHEYSTFISLINQNPGLKKVSETTLEQIIKSTNSSFGVLYQAENDTLRQIASFGIEQDNHPANYSKEIINQLITEQETFEKIFNDNFPSMKMGHLNISIKNVLMVPIIYNNRTVAVIELLAEKIIPVETKEYLLSIREQLAIGLTNASAFEQMENLVKELKELNANYLNQNEKLKHLSNELIIKAEELDKEKNKAVDLTKAKSQFLANMSHELKTPLNSILGLTEISLKENEIKDNVKEKLAIVLRNGKRLLSLINNILEFSKLESNKSVVNIQKFKISTLIFDVENVIKPLAEQKNISLEINGIKNRDYLIESDQEKIEQIIINLLSNAVKFTSEGSIDLIIDSIKSDLILKVKDSGVGIPEEFQRNIFGEFEQADTGNNKKYGGAGLGLAICKKYCDLLNGTISFESNNSGTTFYCTFKNSIVEKIKFDDIEQVNNYRSNSILVYNNEGLGKLIKEYLPKYEVENLSYNLDEIQFKNLNVHNIIIIDLANNFESSIKLGIDVRNDKRFENSNIIFTYLGDNNSYALNIFDYSNNIFLKDEFISYKNKVERHLNEKINSILIHAEYSDELRLLREEILLYDNSLTLHLTEKLDIENVVQINPDLIISDLFLNNENITFLLHQLITSNEVKNVPVIVNLNCNEDQFPELKSSLKNIVSNSNWFPHDILRVIKNRLNLDYDKEIKSNLFDEELSSGTKTFKDSKTDYQILIVDDDEDTLFTVNEIIKGEGYNTKFAVNGLECINQLSHFTPDLILLDIMMPVMDGFETIKRIRLLPKFKELPVIALTAHAMLENKEIIHKNGFNGIVTKPLNSKILINTVKESLEKL